MRMGMLGVAAAACAAALLVGAAGAGAVQRDPVLQAMDAMLDVERRTEAEYQRVVRDHGRVEPFAEFAHAERGHAEFIEYLYRDRGLPVPPNRWTPDRARSHRTVAEACAASLHAALRVAAQYDAYLEGPRPLPDDVRRAFRHNRNVSKHVQADRFRACGPGAAGAPSRTPRPLRIIPG